MGGSRSSAFSAAFLTDYLVHACATGKVHALHYLLEQTRFLDRRAFPPPQYLLEVAAKNGQADILRYLFDNLPECKKREPWEPTLPIGLSYLDIPEKWESYEDGLVHTALAGRDPIAIFRVLFDYGMSPNYSLGLSGSILSNATACTQLGTFLLQRGADPNNPDCGIPPSKSLLLLAAHNPTPDMLNALIKHGAQIAGSEALRGAVEARQICNARRLLELGADINEVFTDEDWESPEPTCRAASGYALHFAIKGSPLAFDEQNTSAEMVRLLLERGAKTDVLDGEGKTPLQVARETGNVEVVFILKTHEARRIRSHMRL